MNLYLILRFFFFSSKFVGFSYQYFHFLSNILEEFRGWMAEKGTNPNNKKDLLTYVFWNIATSRVTGTGLQK